MRLFLRRTDKDDKTIVATAAAPDGPLDLVVRAHRDRFDFAWRAADGAEHMLGSLSTEHVTPGHSWTRGRVCFTGLMVGPYATGNGAPASAPADFDWFDYAPTLSG